MSPLPDLHPRERQIMEALYELGQASTAEVLAQIADPPSYSSVRAMLGRLEAKGLVTHRQEGLRYVYRPVSPVGEVREFSISRLLRTFFDDSPTQAVAAILDRAAGDLSEEQLDELEALIRDARRKGR